MRTKQPTNRPGDKEAPSSFEEGAYLCRRFNPPELPHPHATRVEATCVCYLSSQGTMGWITPVAKFSG